MSVITGEGRVSILYGQQASPVPPHRSLYLARPDAVGRHPAVAIAHDAYLPTPAIKDLARRLARFGYVAAVPEGTDRDLQGVLEAFAGAWGEWTVPGRVAVVGVGSGAHGAVTAAASIGAVLVLISPDLTGLEIPGNAPLLVVTASQGASAERSRIGHGTWVTYRGLDDRFWDDGAPGYADAAARDAFDRVIGFLDGVLAG